MYSRDRAKHSVLVWISFKCYKAYLAGFYSSSSKKGVFNKYSCFIRNCELTDKNCQLVTYFTVVYFCTKSIIDPVARSILIKRFAELRGSNAMRSPDL